MSSPVRQAIRQSSRLVLLGPPCCGKGTLAQRLVRRYALPHISTGDILRSHLQRKTRFGEEIKQCVQEGRLVPDQLVTDLTMRRLRRVKSGFILDGFPRTLEQAAALQERFDQLDALHLHVEDETVIQRLAGRLSCGSCGSVFNAIFCPPEQEGVCDDCGTALQQRPDDTVEVAVERLRVYHQQSEPVVNFYRERGRLRTVETEALSPELIYQRVIGEETEDIR